MFNWHHYNATTLLSCPAERKSFINFLLSVDRIVLHEDFAGMGTCGAALVQQFNCLHSTLMEMEKDMFASPDGILQGEAPKI